MANIELRYTPGCGQTAPTLRQRATATLLRARAIVRGGVGVVLPHVQAFADDCEKATGVASYGTYPGHQPNIRQALDIFVPVNDPTLGNAVCDFALRNLDHYGVDYVIFRQRIYNPEVATYWRAMADRGDLTQNHFDHVHISFYASANARPGTPTPTPTPNSEEDWLMSVQGDYVVTVLNEMKEIFMPFAKYARDIPGDEWKQGRVGFVRLFEAVNERTEADMPKEDQARALLDAIHSATRELLRRPAGSGGSGGSSPLTAADREAIAELVVAKVRGLAFKAS
ncbi:MAG TPA: hypothetical protein VEI97_16395 [bacterium]|nr:hypothetical protein [bacterium]